MKNQIDKRFLESLMLDQLKKKHLQEKQQQIEYLKKELYALEKEVQAIQLR